MNEHTPGPWEAAHASTYVRSPGLGGRFERTEEFVRLHGSDTAIASDIIDPATGDPSRANARLIAAAPDLLAACERAADALNELLGADYDCAGDLAVVRAAIIKARGTDE